MIENDRWNVKVIYFCHKAHIWQPIAELACVFCYSLDISAEEDSTHVTWCLLVSIPQTQSNLLVFICAQKMCAISINYGCRWKNVLILLNGAYKSDTPLPEFPRSTHGRNITIFGQSGLFFFRPQESEGRKTTDFAAFGRPLFGLLTLLMKLKLYLNGLEAWLALEKSRGFSGSDMESSGCLWWGNSLKFIPAPPVTPCSATHGWQGLMHPCRILNLLPNTGWKCIGRVYSENLKYLTTVKTKYIEGIKHGNFP